MHDAWIDGSLMAFNYSVGLRGQYAHRRSFREHTLLPYVTLGYNWGNNSFLSFDYSFEQSPPLAFMLRPATMDRDAGSYWQGNPDLHSDKRHSLTLSAGIQNLALSLQGRIIKDYPELIPVEVQPGRIISRFLNIGQTRDLSLSLSYTLQWGRLYLNPQLNGTIGD